MKLLSFSLLIAFVGFSLAGYCDYLYWELDPEATLYHKDGRIEQAGNIIDWARFGWNSTTGGSGYLNLYNGPGEDPVTSESPATFLNYEGEKLPNWYYADLSGFEGGEYSYFVELMAENSVYAYMSIGGYSDLADYIARVGYYPEDPKSIKAYHVVPEPTSGLLLLLGVAGLALRRKVRKA